MKKYFVTSIVLSVILIYTLAASAAVPYTGEFASDVVKSLDIMVGDSYGNMNLENSLTRAEFAKIAINASKYRSSVAHGAKISVFQDCTYAHWSAPYVKVAVTNKIITGYPDGTFRPDNTVTFEEAITVMLRLLGYTDEDFGNTWPYGQISLADSIGLTYNISKRIGDVLCREDTLKLVYNTLNAKKKDSDKEYSSEVDTTLYSNVIIMATNKNDTSVSPGTVLTSVGNFDASEDYIGQYVGMKGSLAVKDSGRVLCFTPYVRLTKEYVVYSVLSNSMIVYHNGALTELKLSDNTPVYSGADKLTFAAARSQVSTGDVIYAVDDSYGSVDYLTLIKDSMEGPYTLNSYSSKWYERYSSDSSTLIVVRNGERVSTSDVKTNDIIYYSKELNTVFAYSKSVTGIYEKAIPNKDTPNSVIVSGTEYEIESVEAFRKLSSAGDLSYGSSVTLLMGKDSKIADVLGSDTAFTGSEVYGYLIDAGKKAFESDGENYTSRYVSVVLTDGSEAEYKTERDYSSFVNSVVKVKFEGGMATVTKQNTSSLTGTVSYSNMTIGKTPVSSNVKIIDVSTTSNEYTGTAISTYMQRLDGISLTSSSVLWYKKSNTGEFTELILNDVTGDTSLYGIVTAISESGGGSGMSSVNVTYSLDSDGSEYRYSGGKFSDLSIISPVQIKLAGGSVQTLDALTKLSGSITQINAYSVIAGNTQYRLSDDVVVYRKLSLHNYALMTLSELLENPDEYSIKAYYDKAEKNGGRIRVILAE